MLGIALALIAGYMMGSSSQEEPKFVPLHTGDTLPLVNYNTILFGRWICTSDRS